MEPSEQQQSEDQAAEVIEATEAGREDHPVLPVAPATAAGDADVDTVEAALAAVTLGEGTHAQDDGGRVGADANASADEEIDAQIAQSVVAANSRTQRIEKILTALNHVDQLRRQLDQEIAAAQQRARDIAKRVALEDMRSAFETGYHQRPALQSTLRDR